MSQEKSKENQSSYGFAYRFGEFELLPNERMLKRQGNVVPLPPKTLDALLCLVSRAGHLVSKAELTSTLWPSTHVSEANLTNLIVGLRKIIGRDAISTVSKHGYRFAALVEGEPGAGHVSYQRFVRAKELTVQRALNSLSQAREMYWICIAENPGFAPAWAWLGRCCWALAKFGGESSNDVEIAIAALRRAMALDPDLACAHQFYTPVETDTGESQKALMRLVKRIENHPSEPETLVGLVQVLRFCGLLEESTDVNQRATELDPTAITSVPHTLFLMGEYAATIETYSGRAGYYLDAAAWAALGELTRCAALLRSRLSQATPLSKLMAGLMSSLLAAVEGRADEAVSQMRSTDVAREPEGMVYLARQYSYLGLSDLAIHALRSALQSGFVCAPHTLRNDPWLSKIRKHSEFQALLTTAETLTEQMRSIWAGSAQVSLR